jgi:hypothetical protein
VGLALSTGCVTRCARSAKAERTELRRTRSYLLLVLLSFSQPARTFDRIITRRRTGGENQSNGWYSRGRWYHLILFARRPFAGRSSHRRPALSTTSSQLTSHQMLRQVSSPAAPSGLV